MSTGVLTQQNSSSASLSRLFLSLISRYKLIRGSSISKGDALGRPEIVDRTYPPCVEDRMLAIREFTLASENINRTIMDLISDRLGLSRAILREKHTSPGLAISQSRLVRTPPRPVDRNEVALGAHTDFGSLVSNLKKEIYRSNHFQSRSFIIY